MEWTRDDVKKELVSQFGPEHEDEIESTLDLDHGRWDSFRT